MHNQVWSMVGVPGMSKSADCKCNSRKSKCSMRFKLLALIIQCIHVYMHGLHVQAILSGTTTSQCIDVAGFLNQGSHYIPIWCSFNVMPAVHKCFSSQFLLEWGRVMQAISADALLPLADGTTCSASCNCSDQCICTLLLSLHAITQTWNTLSSWLPNANNIKCQQMHFQWGFFCTICHQ